MTIEESLDTGSFGGSSKLSPSGFFNYVFNFDSDNKAILLNMFQYIIIALIPVIVLLKMIKENDYEDKGYNDLFIKDVKQLKQIIDFTKLDLNTLFYIGGPIWEKNIDSYIDYINKYNNIELDSYSFSDSEFDSTLRKLEEESKKELNVKNTNINFNNKLESIGLNKDELEIVLNLLKGNIGYILPKGDRYKIFDNSITAEQYGGRYKKRFIEFI